VAATGKAEIPPFLEICASRGRVFVVVTEYDNSGLDVRGAELFSTLCERDGVCPRLVRLNRHNHLSEVLGFNTPDEYLGRQIHDFINRGR
jgi:hypothetical protein